MPVVTDKKYYLDENLKKILDMCITRQKKKFDHLWIVDGDEGYGKSTMVLAPAYYLAHQTGATFNVKENIFFDLDKMLERAATTERQVFVWDEAAIGGMGMQWQSKTQQKLIQMLMVARKKGHFWFFVIPKFFKLNEYIVIDRAIGLIHVYSHDDMTRGRFVYFDRKRKNKLYYEYRKKKIRNYKHYTFHGKFTNASHIIDMEVYDQLKDQAIIDIYKDGEGSVDRYKELAGTFALLCLDYNISVEEMCDRTGKATRTISRWRKWGKDLRNATGQGPLHSSTGGGEA
jgi:hypothetical protein|tara:strand:+ start:212 stop:1072 length:861 start_codon:yes stop_codon:yes gene_type:complete